MEGMSNDWMTRYFKNVTLSGQQGIEWMTQLGLVALAGSMMLTRLALSRVLTWVSPRRVLYGSIVAVAAGAITMQTSSDYHASLGAALLIGGGLAAAFPLILAYIGDVYPQQSGTAFSTIFALALLGNMIVNKSFGYVAQRYGMAQYATTLLVCLAISALLIVLLHRILDTLPAKENV
jgi:MFS family permease